MLNLTLVKGSEKYHPNVTVLYLIGDTPETKQIGTYSPGSNFSSGEYLQALGETLYDLVKQYGSIRIDYRDETVPAQPKPEGRCC